MEMSSKKRSKKESHCELDSMLDRIEKKLDLLKENFETFKNDVKTQNSLVVSVLGENNIAMKNIMKHQNPKYKRMFPLNSIAELQNIDDDINTTNEQEYITTIKAIIGNGGLKKGLADIVAEEVLVKYNVDGTHEKLRFLNYKKLINVLFMATCETNKSEKSFKENLKLGIRLAKNRFFKDKMKKKNLDSNDPVIFNENPNTSKEPLPLKL